MDHLYISKLLLDTAELLDESAGANGLSRRIFKESDEYISKKDYAAKKAELLKKQSHATKPGDIARITSQIRDLEKKRNISQIIVDKAGEKDLKKENKKLSDDIKHGVKHKTRDLMRKTTVHDTLNARSAHQIDPNFKTDWHGKRTTKYFDEKDGKTYTGDSQVAIMDKQIGKSKALEKVDKLNKKIIAKEQENEKKTSAVNKNINTRANNESVEYMSLMLEAADLLDD